MGPPPQPPSLTRNTARLSRPQASRVAWVPTSSAYAASDLALVVAGRGSQDLAGEAGSLVALLRVAIRQPDDSAHLGVTTTQQWRLPGVVNDLHVRCSTQALALFAH